MFQCSPGPLVNVCDTISLPLRPVTTCITDSNYNTHCVTEQSHLRLQPHLPFQSRSTLPSRYSLNEYLRNNGYPTGGRDIEHNMLLNAQLQPPYHLCNCDCMSCHSDRCGYRFGYPGHCDHPSHHVQVTTNDDCRHRHRKYRGRHGSSYSPPRAVRINSRGHSKKSDTTSTTSTSSDVTRSVDRKAKNWFHETESSKKHGKRKLMKKQSHRK